MSYNLLRLFISIFCVIFLTGCTFVFQKGRRTDQNKIEKLKDEIASLESDKDSLARAKAELESRLRNEIRDEEVTVEMQDKGLVITFVAEFLFDSGKADLRQESLQKIDKVVKVLATTVKDYYVGIEGHTDNVPIKHSGWKSNWELSAQRALSVLHYVIDRGKLDPKRFSVIGYGEFRPVAPNKTPEGRQQNRRVEIVILPELPSISGR